MIPTAKEFITKDFNKDKGSITSTIWTDDAINLAIEFAKLHVKAALKAAANNATIDYYPSVKVKIINKNSILKAYPLTNIK